MFSVNRNWSFAEFSAAKCAQAVVRYAQQSPELFFFNVQNSSHHQAYYDDLSMYSQEDLVGNRHTEKASFFRMVWRVGPRFQEQLWEANSKKWESLPSDAVCLFPYDVQGREEKQDGLPIQVQGEFWGSLTIQAERVGDSWVARMESTQKSLLDWLIKDLEKGESAKSYALFQNSNWLSLFESQLKSKKQEILKHIQEVISKIEEGDCYLANYCVSLSEDQTFDLGSPEFWDRIVPLVSSDRLSQISLFRTLDQVIVSLSPETFIKVENLAVKTFPIKGTFSYETLHGTNSFDEGALRLWANEKEMAEHIMVVDLLRNDLNPLCVPGTVLVEEAFKVKGVSGLGQMESLIQGYLKESFKARDLLALLPAGSISGTPKESVVRIIGELELFPREYYTGILAWGSGETHWDSVLLIRSVFFSRERIQVGVGAGITSASQVEQEWQELVLKLRSFLGGSP